VSDERFDPNFRLRICDHAHIEVGSRDFLVMVDCAVAVVVMASIDIVGLAFIGAVRILGPSYEMVS